MVIIEPHIHMFSRTTDEYCAMYNAGIRACVEPSFWLGANREYAGSFFDYFKIILDFETVRAARFGIDHYAAISVNPKEAEDLGLAREVIAGLDRFLAHERCLAVGEIGLNNITENEAKVFAEQLEIAKNKNLPVIIHLPHFNKTKGIDWTAQIVKDSGISPDRVLIDHNTEECMRAARETGCWTGMTVYPISKLDPPRAANLVKEYGTDRMIISGSADWGVSDPLSLVKVCKHMEEQGFPEAEVKKILFENPNDFYSRSPRWKPNFDIKPLDPREFQR